MTTQKCLRLVLCVFFTCLTSVMGITNDTSKSQNEYEKSVDAVVRNKLFYKAGKFEVTGGAGILPYDSLMTHYHAGGRLTWHFSDHYAWEVADVQYFMPSVSSFTTDLVSSKGLTTGGIQTQKLKLTIGSNFVVSPLYGKLSFLGASVLHFDIYALAGLGYAFADIAKYSLSGSTVQESILSSSGNVMVNFGFGIKLFLNDAMGVVVDFRDYVTMTTLWGSTNPKSNFTMNLGVIFFLPTFG